MNSTIFTTLTEEELTGIIRSCIKEELSVYYEANSKKPNYDMLSMNELVKMLGVTKPTIIEWTKKGLLTAHRLGRRVFYKRDLVERSLRNYQGSLTTEARMSVALNHFRENYIPR